MPNPSTRISALALATRDHGIYVRMGQRELRFIRPAWTPAEAEQFLIEHNTELNNIVMEAAYRALEKTIEEHERRMRHGG